MKQTTLEKSVTISGIGLHSGLASVLTLKPAPVNTGIVFFRSDIENSPAIKATYNNVVDTKNCTCLGKDGVLLSTIEHLMAALYILEIDNVIIECSNPELPILDGSAEMFLHQLKDIKVVKQSEKRKILKLLKPIKFEDDKANFVQMSPNADNCLRVCFDIEFASKIVGHQNFDDIINFEIFEEKIAPCRTFCEKYQIDYLKSIGLIKGGSLENAVVLDGETILNPEGFKVENECVNHKVLDLIGDMYTSGYRIQADIKAYRSGHFHNNEILKKLFADSSNFEIL
ncbi:MAG: UDP-3-O-[3-hydroxymyristoyl] N-acetylglucosamine deacetylase [Alphaproteobacteria bacterium]|nr:UDP-3-O-[3-hydroxymyristoyl] N-acetylglucosamine deacetylase [Alphaproteobacteria bacterium]